MYINIVLHLKYLTFNRYVSSTVPEIRHKTAISTIMSLSDRHSNATKSKSSSSDRSRHKERVREGTISSLARDKVTVKDKTTRSADTSLDRESGQSKDKTHRRDKSREKYKSHESSDKLKRITEELGSDAEKRNKTIFDKKSSGMLETYVYKWCMMENFHTVMQ